MKTLARRTARRTLNMVHCYRELVVLPEVYPPGHYYSPIPSIDQVRRHEGRIFSSEAKEIPGVDVNEAGQLRMFEDLKGYYPEQPWSDQENERLLYFFENEYFGAGDALILYAFLRHLRPRRIVEVGSGYSSRAMLDTNEIYLENAMECSFIDPYPDRLVERVKGGDASRFTLIQSPVQDVADQTFSQLESGDILFIDSTHVSKIDSDVNHILFRILPMLASGVYVHVHDIFFPFEYPKEWIYRGRAWNETYLLRAFLQFNSAFEIVYFNQFFATFHFDALETGMPLAAKRPGQGIWLRKR